jgi:hypothetical protein
MRESNDNIFYCAECTYDKSNGTMFLYTTDITEVRGSVKPRDSMKVEGGFLVRRKYFRSEYEAQEYIDSLPNAMPMSKNESFRMRESSRNSRYVNESFNEYLNGTYYYAKPRNGHSKNRLQEGYKEVLGVCNLVNKYEKQLNDATDEYGEALRYLITQNGYGAETFEKLDSIQAQVCDRYGMAFSELKKTEKSLESALEDCAGMMKQLTSIYRDIAVELTK